LRTQNYPGKSLKLPIKHWLLCIPCNRYVVYNAYNKEYIYKYTVILISVAYKTERTDKRMKEYKRKMVNLGVVRA
jgi:hypothetical protein